MTALYVSVINHDNDLMIIENAVLAKLASNFNVIIKTNTPATKELIKHCTANQITLLDSNYGLGFSSNNNFVYHYCTAELGMNESDLFLVLNPDVIIDSISLVELITMVNRYNTPISTINLYRDNNKTIPEQSIKKFPDPTAPLKALLLNKRTDAYDKASITEPQIIDWAAGSFLLFRAKHFKILNGFNEKYFMYFEDVDLCRRAYEKGIKLTYFPCITAVHIGSYSNRNIFSKNFWWYIRSYIRYHFQHSINR